MDAFLVSFFFFSGYFYRPGKRSIKESIKNRAKALIVPFFRYSLFFWLVGTIYLVATKAEPLVEAIPFIWGLGLVCAQAEKAGVRTKELAWLGSHSLIIYLYHMFLAWIIGIITGFSVFYEDPSDGRTIALSVLLTLACLALAIGRNIVEDRLQARKSV